MDGNKHYQRSTAPDKPGQPKPKQEGIALATIILVALLALFGCSALAGAAASFRAERLGLTVIICVALGLTLFYLLFRVIREVILERRFTAWVTENWQEILEHRATYQGQHVRPDSELRQYTMTISFWFVTLPAASRIFVDGEKPALFRRVEFTIWTFLFGWWGFPLGPFATVKTLGRNIRGGDKVELTTFIAAYVPEESLSAYFAQTFPDAPWGYFSRSGFDPELWSDDTLLTKWNELARFGPGQAKPERRLSIPSPYADCAGTLYVALYPRAMFENLLHFVLYTFYSQSIQDALIETGEIELEEFDEPSPDWGVARMRDWITHMATLPDRPDLTERLQELELPPELNWLTTLKYSAWTCLRDDGHFSIDAQTSEGYLTLFLIDD